jgi:hypothetical protein
MGEADEPKKTALAQASEDVMVADTMGGRMYVRWDETAHATPHGQIVFFAEFLATAGVFDRWVQGCPLHYSSPNASRPRDVLGTLMLGRRSRVDQVDDRQCSCGDPACQSCCGAVAQARPLEGIAGLHLPTHRRSDRLADPTTDALGTGVAAVFRLSGSC